MMDSKYCQGIGKNQMSPGPEIKHGIYTLVNRLPVPMGGTRGNPFVGECNFLNLFLGVHYGIQ